MQQTVVLTLISLATLPWGDGESVSKFRVTDPAEVVTFPLPRDDEGEFRKSAITDLIESPVSKPEPPAPGTSVTKDPPQIQIHSPGITVKVDFTLAAADVVGPPSKLWRFLRQYFQVDQHEAMSSFGMDLWEDCVDGEVELISVRGSFGDRLVALSRKHQVSIEAMPEGYHNTVDVIIYRNHLATVSGPPPVLPYFFNHIADCCRSERTDYCILGAVAEEEWLIVARIWDGRLTDFKRWSESFRYAGTDVRVSLWDFRAAPVHWDLKEENE